MPTRKISDLFHPDTCQHYDHDPQKHRIYESGLYEHECPSCHSKQIFAVNRPTWLAGQETPYPPHRE